jgi:hypothetical protein
MTSPAPERPPPPCTPPEGWAYQPAPDPDWRVVDYGSCHAGATRHVRACGKPAAAALHRAHSHGRTDYYYCGQHLYGRWIQDGQVWAWRLSATVPDPPGPGSWPHQYGPHGEGRRRTAIPYTGPPVPHLEPGDLVQVRDKTGRWLDKVAAGPARYDHAYADRRVWLSVPVARPGDWLVHGPGAAWVNWPAEDVRRRTR